MVHGDPSLVALPVRKYSVLITSIARNTRYKYNSFICCFCSLIPRKSKSLETCNCPCACSYQGIGEMLRSGVPTSITTDIRIKWYHSMYCSNSIRALHFGRLTVCFTSSPEYHAPTTRLDTPDFPNPQAPYKGECECPFENHIDQLELLHPSRQISGSGST